MGRIKILAESRGNRTLDTLIAPIPKEPENACLPEDQGKCRNTMKISDKRIKYHRNMNLFAGSKS
jgi:hypothetical protein